MQRKVDVFIVSSERAGAPPSRETALVVEAPNEDGLLEAARTEPVNRGYRVRAVSFTPTGLVAHGEAAS